MAIVNIKIEGMAAVQREFADIAANQIPYATALSLTRTAQDSQAVIRDQVLPKEFILRRASWARSGIRITAATKRVLMAAIEDINKYMELQETGGTKLPYKDMLAVPLSGARPTLRSLIRFEDYPAQVMARGGFINKVGSTLVMFAVALKRGRQKGLSRRVKGFAQAKWARQVIPMYALVPRATIPARYGFVKAVGQVVQARWRGNFEAAFQQAVRTSTR